MSNERDICIAALHAFDSNTSLDDYNFFGAHLLEPLPLEVESMLCESWPDFRLLGSDDWSALREKAVLETAAKLLAYSLRMATLAVRSQSVSAISWGTMALVVDPDLLDIRDVYRVLCALHDAAGRLDADPSGPMRECALFATPSRRSSITDGFLRGPDYMKNLASMKMSTIHRNGVLWYKGGL
jgi:hypothetical protein